MEGYATWKEQFANQVKEKATFYENFPKQGVTFMDLFSLTNDPAFFKMFNDGTVKVLEEEVGQAGVDFNVIVGLESRGFIQGPILAMHFGVPFVPIRKKGKLPGECY